MDLADRAQSVTGACGPLNVRVEAADSELASISRTHLDLFSRPWRETTRSVDVAIARSDDEANVAGSYLECGNMRVDRDGGNFVASTFYGLTARGTMGEHADTWKISVPEDLVLGERQINNLEDLFSLICTAGWRAEGWIAVHAGAVIGPSCCAVLCASSGGGKSTLTAALLVAGWTTLGDDKLLLRMNGTGAELRPLLNTLNLHPQTRDWLPVPEIEHLPRYSAMTEKRRVGVRTLTKAPLPDAATPTHLIAIERTRGHNRVRASRMAQAEILPTLLRQIVIPRDPSAARAMLQVAAAACARSIKTGVRLEIGDGAYRDAGWFRPLEHALA
jgi:hypothetical protein